MRDTIIVWNVTVTKKKKLKKKIRMIMIKLKCLNNLINDKNDHLLQILFPNLSISFIIEYKILIISQE